jgi:hypothetical protein
MDERNQIRFSYPEKIHILEKSYNDTFGVNYK